MTDDQSESRKQLGGRSYFYTSIRCSFAHMWSLWSFLLFFTQLWKKATCSQVVLTSSHERRSSATTALNVFHACKHIWALDCFSFMLQSACALFRGFWDEKARPQKPRNRLVDESRVRGMDVVHQRNRATAKQGGCPNFHTWHKYACLVSNIPYRP